MKRHSRFAFWIVALTGLLLAVSACSTAAVENPEGDADLVSTGESLFQANCASCHGADARGTDKGPSFLSRVYVPSHHGDAAFLLAVRNGSPQHHWGFGDMEPVEGLTDEDVVAITAFVREIQRIQGFEE